MANVITRTAVGLVILVLSATSASAECAWVLWTLSESGPRWWRQSNWSIHSGHKTEEECNILLRWEQRDLPGTQTVRRLCIPDTVDPRGPKGK